MNPVTFIGFMFLFGYVVLTSAEIISAKPCTQNQECLTEGLTWCSGIERCNRVHWACEILLRCSNPSLPYCDEEKRTCLESRPMSKPSMLTALSLSSICTTRECCVKQTMDAYSEQSFEKTPWCLGDIQLGSNGQGCVVTKRCLDPETECDEAHNTCRRLRGEVTDSTDVKGSFDPCFSNDNCDDSIFCNGEEICANGECVNATTLPCAIGEQCIEVNQTCNATQTGGLPVGPSIRSHTTLFLVLLITALLAACVVGFVLIRAKRKLTHSSKHLPSREASVAPNDGLYQSVFGKQK